MLPSPNSFSDNHNSNTITTLSPIALFTYNRPDHTEQTLNALMKNRLSGESILYIYSDGARTEADQAAVQAVRTVLRKEQWCKEVHIIERSKNFGLADNIIEGVSQMVNQYGKVIVLEDDVLAAPGFLDYMNVALTYYEKETAVMHISGYMFPLGVDLPETFFLNTTSCWGWGTWKRSWNYFNPDPQALLNKLEKKGIAKKFDMGGHAGFIDQLANNINGNIKTWAVKWNASMYLNNGYALHPGKSLTQNIGNDGTGENHVDCENFLIEDLAKAVNIRPIKITESKIARNAMEQFYLDLNTERKKPLERIKRLLKKLSV